MTQLADNFCTKVVDAAHADFKRHLASGGKCSLISDGYSQKAQKTGYDITVAIYISS